MRTVTVSVSKTYDIKIGAGLLDTVGRSWERRKRPASSATAMYFPCTADGSAAVWKGPVSPSAVLYSLPEKKAKMPIPSLPC